MKNIIAYASCVVLYRIYKGKNPVADTAFLALTSRGYATQRGFCQKFVRVILERALGRRIWPVNPVSAKEAAQWLRENMPQCEVKGPLQGGDLLYKETGSGVFGHVGILFYGGRYVIENSSADADKNGDARGIRSLREFGRPSFVARIL